MSFIHQANINDVQYDIIGSCYYGTSSTAAGTAAKVATVSNADGFVLVPGVQVAIKFTAANTASSPTLNVNSTGAKTMKYRGAAITSSTYYWGANQVVTFIYDGEAWQTTDYLKNPNSDTKVTQNVISADAEYPLLLKYNANSTDVTNTVKYASAIVANPSNTRIRLGAGSNYSMIDPEGIRAFESNSSTMTATVNELSLINSSTDSCVLFAENNNGFIMGSENELEKNIVNTTYNYGDSAINHEGSAISYGNSEIKYDGSLLQLGLTSTDSSYGVGNVIRLGFNNVIESPDQAQITVTNQIPFDLQSNSGFALFSSTQDSGESGLFFNAGGINAINDPNKKIDFDNGIITGFQMTGGAVPQRYSLTATAGQTSFSIPFDYDSSASNLTVYHNGILLKDTDNYTVNTTNNTINLAGYSAEAGDIITVMGLIGVAGVDIGDDIAQGLVDIENALASAQTTISSAQTTAVNAVNSAKNTATTAVSSAQTTAVNAVNSAKTTAVNEINAIKTDITTNSASFMKVNAANTMGANGKITMNSAYTPSNNYDVVTKTYVDTKLAGFTTDVFHVGTSAPSNTKLLWIDTNTGRGVLTYYNGSAWTRTSSVWT